MKNFFKIFMSLLIVGVFGALVSLSAFLQTSYAEPTENPPAGNVIPTFSAIFIETFAAIFGDLGIAGDSYIYGDTSLYRNVTVGENLTFTGQPTATSDKAEFKIQGLGLVDAFALDLEDLDVTKKTAGDFIIYDDLTVGPNFGETGHWASPVTTLYGMTRHIAGPIILGEVLTDNTTFDDEVLYVGDFNSYDVPADKRNDGDVVIEGDLTVGFGSSTGAPTGNIVANKIGSIYEIRSSAGESINGERLAWIECNSNDYLVGCSANFIYDSNSDRNYGTRMVGTMCRAHVHDAGGSNDTVHLYGKCFDPEGETEGTVTKTVSKS